MVHWLLALVECCIDLVVRVPKFLRKPCPPTEQQQQHLQQRLNELEGTLVLHLPSHPL